MICCASNMLYEQGFSTKTSLPAWTAQIVCSVWWKLGVARDTASMLWSSSTLRMSVNVAGRFLPAASTILQPFSSDRLIDVAERRDLDVGDLQIGGDVRLAPAVEPDDGHSDRVVLTGKRTRLERHRQRHRAHQEVSAIDFRHDVSFA